MRYLILLVLLASCAPKPGCYHDGSLHVKLLKNNTFESTSRVVLIKDGRLDFTNFYWDFPNNVIKEDFKKIDCKEVL